MNENNKEYLNIREVVKGIGVTCRGPAEERLKVLFKLHMPPFFSELDIPGHKDVADALEFFEGENNFIVSLFFKNSKNN